MQQEKTFTGLKTTDGKNIYSQTFLQNKRQQVEENKSLKDFVAQAGAQEWGLGNVADITVFGGNRGGGKANSYYTPVATPSGFRLMKDLEVGDLICTPYDGIQKVSAIYEQGTQTSYHFYFDDGSMLTCMDSHQFWARKGSAGEFSQMSARDIMDNYVLDQQYPVSLRKGNSEFFEVPLCGEVEMNEKITPLDLPIPPFIIGYLSGDGYWRFTPKGYDMVGSNMWVRNKFRGFGYRINRDKDEDKNYLRGISDDARRRFTHSRVPTPARITKEYKTASVQARWDFLVGVFLRSGRKKNTRPCLYLTNKAFLEDVVEVARSLGVWAKIYQVTDDPKYMGCWAAIFYMPDETKLYRYNSAVQKGHVNGITPTKPNEEGMLTKKILWIGKGKKQEFRCITVTGRDHLYMTDAYTVNHNTVTMLMEPLYDIQNKHFNGIIFRKSKDDFENIINESKRWFAGLGRYNKSKDDMTWNFKTGSKLGLTIYNMPMSDFDIAYRGQQFAYIGIDELPQMPFEMFKFLMTCNRNTVGLHSRILGTCNPDPLSWLRQFIDWWIGKEDTVYADGKKHPERKGFAIPERVGKIRYCYMPDDSVENIIWGDSPQEVYEQCKEMIDDAWDPQLEKYGYTKESFFVKSVTFIKANLMDNKALLQNDPGYIASLLNQPPEVRAREFDGNWDIIQMGDDMIQAFHLDKCFQNAQVLEDKVRRATCDVAGEGGDNCVTWLWIGWHVADVFVCRRDPYTTVEMLRSKLQEWGVLEQNFAYDLNGMGQVLKGAFPKAVPFNNQEAVALKDKNLYDNIKSQCAYKFAERTQQANWSIEPTLLDRKYKIGKETRTLYSILQLERKCVKQDMSKADKGWCLIHKEQMKNKAVVGHSPDFFEALFMREVFDIKHSQAVVPGWVSKSKNVIGVRHLGVKQSSSTSIYHNYGRRYPG